MGDPRHISKLRTVITTVRRRRNGGGATMATQPLDTLSAERWARLREDLRRCELRRGAWYPVLSVAPDEAVLVVRRRGVIIPLAYLEITNTRPDRWTFLPASATRSAPTAPNASPSGNRPPGCAAASVMAFLRWSPFEKPSRLLNARRA